MSIESEPDTFPRIEDIIIITLPKLLEQSFFERLDDSLLLYLEEHKTKGIIFDFHEVHVMDKVDVTHFQSTIYAAKIMGVPSVLTGLSDALVAGLIAVEAEMQWADISSTVEEALKYFSCTQRESE